MPTKLTDQLKELLETFIIICKHCGSTDVNLHEDDSNFNDNCYLECNKCHEFATVHNVTPDMGEDW